MNGSGRFDRGAFERKDWHSIYERLSARDDLDAGDLELLAVAAHLIGCDDESQRAWERAQREHVDQRDPASGSRCAFWLGLQLLFRGQVAQADGWLARAERLAAQAGTTCAIQGLVLLPRFLRVLWDGAPSDAEPLAQRMLEIAAACQDQELLAFGLLCRGEALLAAGESEEGMRLLDEAMVAVAAGEVSPIAAGILYCAVIEACVDALDLRRAAEWTDALERWCDDQSGVVPYRGACLVHRSQVLQARGAWDAAMSEASAARQLLATNSHPAAGNACYQLGELHRLRGDFGDAMRAYRQANDHGRDPTPGMLLLRVAEGRASAAVAAVDRMLEHSRGLRTRPTMLSAAVEVLLAAGQLDAARQAADELESLRGDASAPYLLAMADFAIGCVRLADGKTSDALPHLRRASAAFGEMDVPFEAARARVQLALTYRALADDDAAEIELEAAHEVFDRLGAQPELERLALLRSSGGQRPDVAHAHGLTAREFEVLRQVATGGTNRQIAADLHISEHTVARHLQNIFAKLGVSSRAAATAFAHARDLL